jgi:alpha-L-fucosidase
VDTFALDAWNDGNWQEFASAASIGNARLVSTPNITTSKVRLRITEAAACPAISEFGLFQMPVRLEEPRIKRGRDGLVTISGHEPEVVIRYTCNSSEPTATSTLYEAPFSFLQSGTIRARAFLPDENLKSDVTTASYEVSKCKWKVVSERHNAEPRASEPRNQIENVIDEDPQTMWITQNMASATAPQGVVVDMGEALTLKGFTFLPRQDGKLDGTPDRYEFYVSTDGRTWNTPVDAGEFSNIKANPTLQTKIFDNPVTGSFFRFVVLRTLDNADYVAIAEIGIVTR